MTDICLIFEVHQPFRLNRRFSRELLSSSRRSEDLFELYFDLDLNRKIFDRVSRECYLPANEVLLNLIEEFRERDRKFKVSFSLSGIFLEQCKMWRPEILESFKEIVKSGCCELLCQTYYHSLSSFISNAEFIEQIRMHRKAIKDIFNFEPRVFENTECIYNNRIAKTAEQLGFEAVVTEGTERILGWRKPNYIYRAKDSRIRLLLRNYRLSDDIGFRFSSREWDEWPLTADKYACWLASTPGDVIVIFIDYETFGEHYRRESGIFDFLEWLPREILRWSNLSFSTPSEVIRRYYPADVIDVSEDETVSWADLERDLSAWLGNTMQNASFNLLKEMEPIIKAIGDDDFIRIWRYLQASDHFYYMCTKGGGSGDVHSAFNPYFSPVEAFVVFIRILSDFQSRLHLKSERPEFRHKLILRRVSPEKGFTFYIDFSKPTGLTAYSLHDFYSILRTISEESIRFHMARGDFERWILQVIGYRELADDISNINDIEDGNTLRRRLLDIIGRRINELEKNAKG
mgnify:FL=1